MAVPTQPPLLRKTHRNSYLFSNYYLDERLTHRDDWALDEAETRAAFEALRQQWRDFSANGTHAKLNESQTEQRWVRPVLEALGHRYAVQVALATPRQTRFPDYLLFTDDAARARAEHQSNQAPLTEADLASALAVADAKRWDRPLDKATKSQDDDLDKQISATPSVQIDFYIRHSGLDWGVLTNGREWRLYHKASSKKLDVYYEIDLPALLEQDDLDAFKYFYRFFRQAAFLPDASGNCWLDRIRERSDTYERGVSDGLKRQVYDALTDLAQGFLDFPGNGLNPTPATRREIYDNSLIVLYRLLFILYAEARNLLPVDASAGGNVVYRDEYSFQHIKEEVVAQIRLGKTGVATRSSVWNGLVELWETIDRGDPNLDVPAYNGGLFKPGNHAFLQRYRVGDSHLISAIDKLARVEDPETGLRVFVDYRDLEIRHLGSIYEGLLEYSLEVDEAGRVELLTDKGERKATGSYYTPDYIVQYIVEQTVGPVLDEILEAVTGSAGDKVGADVDFDAGVELARRALQINVLDPAMGSGHFLVAATDYIARWLVEWGATPTPPQPSPQRGGSRDSAFRVSSVSNQLAHEPPSPRRGERTGEGVSSALAYWRRRVAQACIYGVDLNPLAVELAKLALWLTTVAQDKPLSFLDHHLRCGNSLIGARLDELTLGVPRQKSTQKTKERKARAAGQMTMLDDSAFVGSLRTATRWMGDIEGLSGETLAEVREAEQIYQQTVRDATRTLRTIADVWTAQHFGLGENGLGEDVTYLQNLSRHLLHPGGIAMPRYETTVAQARNLAAQHRFFHWELEFPEVFFDEEGQPLGESAGFDAVVGNPPYVRMETFKELKDYLRSEYFVYETRADIYAYFVEQSLSLLRENSSLSFIVSNKWLRSNYGRRLRQLVFEKTEIQELIDFGDLPVFEATTYPLVFVVKKSQPSSESQFRFTEARDLLFTTLYEIRDANSIFVLQQSLSSDEWQLVDSSTSGVLNKLVQTSVSLAEYISGPSLMGIKSGLNEAFIIDENTKDKLISVDPGASGILFPLVSGNLIRRYQTNYSGDYLIYTKHGVDIERYPSIKKYLSQFRIKLEKRATDQNWYELQQPQAAYLPVLQQPKIIMPDLAERGRFSLDRNGLFLTNTAYFLPCDSLFLLSLLNSKLLTFCLEQTSATFRGGYLRLFGQYVEKLPIPRIDFTTSADERERLAAQGQRLYATFAARSGALRRNAGREALPPPRDAERRSRHSHAERGNEPGRGDEALLCFVADELSAGRSDVVHDLLAFLAEQMIDLHQKRQRLDRANDPFKWLDRGAAVDKLERVLRHEITYGERVDEPLLDQPHDLDGLRLAQSPSGWTLEAQLKLREVDDPKQWQKEANGRDIVREWVAVYRFAADTLDEVKARYFRYALEARSGFAQTKNFPGGATRSTMQKLRLAALPLFDASVDLTPLDGLRAELAAVQGQIAQTDRLVDRIVYGLYSLTEEEVALVEG